MEFLTMERGEHRSGAFEVKRERRSAKRTWMEHGWMHKWLKHKNKHKYLQKRLLFLAEFDVIDKLAK